MVVTVDSSVTASMLAAGSNSHELVVGNIGLFKTNDAYGNSCPGPDGNHSFLAVRATYGQAVGEISTITVVTGVQLCRREAQAGAFSIIWFRCFLSTTSGVITSTLIGYWANFSASTHSVRVEPMFADTTSASCAGVAGCKGMSPDGTVTSIVIGGTASTYLDGGSASVSCTGLTGCTGMEFSAHAQQMAYFLLSSPALPPPPTPMVGWHLQIVQEYWAAAEVDSAQRALWIQMALSRR